MSVLQQTLPPSQTELWSHIKLWARALGARTCRRAQKSSFNFSYSILPVRADRSSSAGSCFFIKVQDKRFDGQHRPSSRKRLEEKLFWLLIRGDLSCRSPLLKKVSTGHFFQFTPAERLRQVRAPAPNTLPLRSLRSIAVPGGKLQPLWLGNFQ